MDVAAARSRAPGPRTELTGGLGVARGLPIPVRHVFLALSCCVQALAFDADVHARDAGVAIAGSATIVS